MVERIRQICEERGISLGKLCADLNIPQTIYRWDTNKPSIDKVCVVAEYLGVSVDFLCDRTDVREIGDGSDLDRAERGYIEDFRRLSEYDRGTVLALIDRELSRPAERKLLRIRRSLQAASAGVGVPLDDEAFDEIFVADSPQARRAAFALPITGDSMEPLYHDGDLILVESCTDVEIGEIGVFAIDGCGFVKKRGDGVLLSLNDKYSPIPFDASIRCFGRVIGSIPIRDIYI